VFQNVRGELERSHDLVFAYGRERIQERLDRVSGREIPKENPRFSSTSTGDAESR
jgi:hypothetical protein